MPLQNGHKLNQFRAEPVQLIGNMDRDHLSEILV